MFGPLGMSCEKARDQIRYQCATNDAWAVCNTPAHFVCREKGKGCENEMISDQIRGITMAERLDAVEPACVLSRSEGSGDGPERSRNLRNLEDI